MSAAKRCTACHGPTSKEVIHPLLFVPICKTCDFHYHNGEFTIEDGNEIFCRLCGEGEGQLLLCDSCPKSFCARCVENVCGKAELRRIQQLSDRWHCFICSPQPLLDLCTKNGWNYHGANVRETNKRQYRKGLVYADISKGREKFEIPVINEVDSAPPPTNFIYVTEPVAGEGVILSNNPNLFTCCSCTDNCRDPTKCECALRMGGSFAYDSSGTMLHDKPDGIYECNSRCSCHVSRCHNRVVGRGPHLRLEVFRCENPAKGWGVRCRDDIHVGQYVCDYLGEILLEEDSENRGLRENDEYLFTLDSWGRMCAANKVRELGLKQRVRRIKREEDVDPTVLTKEDVSEILHDADLVELLESKGAIRRALEMGKQLREDPDGFLQQQQALFRNEHCDAAGGSAGKGSSKRRVAPKPQSTPKRLRALLDLDNADISKTLDDDSPEGKTKARAGGKGGASSSSAGGASSGEGKQFYRSWLELRQIARQRAVDQAQSVVTDRIVTQVEEETTTYTVDGRCDPAA